MVFYHIKESNDQLIILDRDDVIQILLDIREDILARTSVLQYHLQWYLHEEE